MRKTMNCLLFVSSFVSLFRILEDGIAVMISRGSLEVWGDSCHAVSGVMVTLSIGRYIAAVIL